MNIHTKPFIGKDGITYHLFIFCMPSQGFWMPNIDRYRVEYFAAKTESTISGEMIEYIKDTANKSIIKVKIDPSCYDMKLVMFNRRPYKSKKTGLYNAHIEKCFSYEPIVKHSSYSLNYAVYDGKILIPG